jgi:hypothetical protein
MEYFVVFIICSKQSQLLSHSSFCSDGSGFKDACLSHTLHNSVISVPVLLQNAMSKLFAGSVCHTEFYSCLYCFFFVTKSMEESCLRS